MPERGGSTSPRTTRNEAAAYDVVAAFVEEEKAEEEEAEEEEAEEEAGGRKCRLVGSTALVVGCGAGSRMPSRPPMLVFGLRRLMVPACRPGTNVSS